MFQMEDNPYYLHLSDPVPFSHRFRTEEIFVSSRIDTGDAWVSDKEPFQPHEDTLTNSGNGDTTSHYCWSHLLVSTRKSHNGDWTVWISEAKMDFTSLEVR